MKKARINHQKLQHKKDAQVREVHNSNGKSCKYSAGSSCNSSNNPYSVKSKDYSLTKPSSKANNSQKGDKTKTKPDTPTTAPTKGGREDSKSPAPVNSSSSEGTFLKKGAGRSVHSPSKLIKHSHHTSDRGASTTRKPADHGKLQPRYAAPPVTVLCNTPAPPCNSTV